MFLLGRQEPSRTPSIPAAPIKYGYISMRGRAKTLAALTLAVTFSGCATYPGENFLRLTHSNADMDQSKTIAQTRKTIVQLLDHLNVPEGRRATFEKIVPKKLLREAKYAKLSYISDVVVLANGDIDIAFASNSIIVANGNVNISHSGNNIVVTANNIDISGDGKMGGGSLLVAKGLIY